VACFDCPPPPSGRFHVCFAVPPSTQVVCTVVVWVVWVLRGIGALAVCRIGWLSHQRSSAQAAVSGLSHLTNRQRALLGLPAVPDAPSVPMHTPGIVADAGLASGSRPPSGRPAGAAPSSGAATGSFTGTPPAVPRRSTPGMEALTPHRDGPGSGAVAMSPYSPYTPPSGHGLGSGHGVHSAVSLLRVRHLGLESPSGTAAGCGAWSCWVVLVGTGWWCVSFGWKWLSWMCHDRELVCSPLFPCHVAFLPTKPTQLLPQCLATCMRLTAMATLDGARTLAERTLALGALAKSRWCAVRFTAPHVGLWPFCCRFGQSVAGRGAFSAAPQPAVYACGIRCVYGPMHMAQHVWKRRDVVFFFLSC
jgi:hypothetical protein